MEHLCFNSRPHEEVDFPSTSPYSLLVVSTHDLTKRSTSVAADRFDCRSSFNSRPHEEVDQSGEIPSSINTKRFNSRPHEEVDGMVKNPGVKVETFQLTTSRRGRRKNSMLLKKRGCFNSRPHEEVDSNFYAKSFPFKITFCAHCI